VNLEAKDNIPTGFNQSESFINMRLSFAMAFQF
jgi:hypothetical protein